MIIQPGTVVKAAAGHDSTTSGADGSRIEIILQGGTLQASGAADNPVRFTSAATTKNPGDWYGIRILEGDVTLSSCVVEYAVDGIPVRGLGHAF